MCGAKEVFLSRALPTPWVPQGLPGIERFCPKDRIIPTSQSINGLCDRGSRAGPKSPCGRLKYDTKKGVVQTL